MSCNYTCKYKSYGIDDVTKIKFDGSDFTKLNWTEISVPEVLPVPVKKPDIETINQVFVQANIDKTKLLETPYTITIYNRATTTFEISSILDLLQLVDALSLTDLLAFLTPLTIEPVKSLLAVIPEYNAFLGVLTDVEAALNAITAPVTGLVATITTLLSGPCPAANLVVDSLKLLNEALLYLVELLDDLETAATTLITATSLIPALAVTVKTAMDGVISEINALVTIITGVPNGLIAQLQGLINAFGTTQYFTLGRNSENTLLSGRKVIVEGTLSQKVVYTALEPSQSVHSACFEYPFSAFIIVYPKFVGLTPVKDVTVLVNPGTCATQTLPFAFPYDATKPLVVDLNEIFDVKAYIEDVFACELDVRNIFKNTTLFISATPTAHCQ